MRGLLRSTNIWGLVLPSLFSAFTFAAPSVTPPRAANTAKHYELKLTWDVGAPDGVSRQMFYVNGQFPAPQIKLDQDDDVEIVVHNETPFNTTIHWHGELTTSREW